MINEKTTVVTAEKEVEIDFTSLLLQEYSANVARIAHLHGICVSFSATDCQVGDIRIHAKFKNPRQKEVFFKTIEDNYACQRIWTV